MNSDTNMNGEKSYIQKYIEDFIDKLSKYPDTYFEKNVLHKNDGRRGTWVPGIENLCFTLEKAKRNNDLEKVQNITKQLYRRNFY